MATTSDDFNRADGALGAGWTVTANAGGDGWVIASNQAKVASGDTDGNHFARNETALDTVNHYCEVVVNEGGGLYGAGPAVRFAAAADTCYWLCVNSGGTLQPWKRVAGSNSTIGSSEAVTFSFPDTVKLEVSGTGTVTLKAYLNGALVQTWTDSASPLDTGVRTGMGGFKNGANNFLLDDFSAADVTATSAAVPVYMAQYRQRS